MNESDDAEATTMSSTQPDLDEDTERINDSIIGDFASRPATDVVASDVEKALVAIVRIRERAKAWGIRATPEEIKSWINEGHKG